MYLPSKLQSWIYTFRRRATLAGVDVHAYNEAMGQQHRARVKRKRRRAYLKRKNTSARSKQRESSRSRTKKAAVPAE